MFVALGALAAAQSKGTEATVKALAHLLDYAGATHPDAVIHYCASGMVLYIHSDASYLNEMLAAALVVTSSTVTPLPTQPYHQPMQSPTMAPSTL
jgi:hypothetical protein